MYFRIKNGLLPGNYDISVKFTATGKNGQVTNPITESCLRQFTISLCTPTDSTVEYFVAMVKIPYFLPGRLKVV